VKQFRTIMNKRILARCLTLFLAKGLASASVVEGPFKPTAPVPDPTKDGIWLTYRASSRTSTNWIDCTQADGSRSRVYVDTGLVGSGIEAYLSLTEELVVLDMKTKQTLWMKPVGAWYHILSFTRAKNADTLQDMQLVRVGGRDGFGRFFEIRTGQKKFLEADGEILVARDEPGRELRGRPVEVLKSFMGNNSRITRPRCERITSREAWGRLWKEHAGEEAVPPDIDVAQQMVVAIFRGETWNCDGIELVHALDCEDALELFVRGRDYQTMVKRDRVCPYGVFAIPKSAKRLIVKADSQVFIGGPPAWVEIGKFEPGQDRNLAPAHWSCTEHSP
jgi:hypothetical protein